MASVEAPFSKYREEKMLNPLSVESISPKPKLGQSYGRLTKLVVFILSLLAIYVWTRPVIKSTLVNRIEEVTDFGDITPNEVLEWHPCFSSFQCARLTVPMDYNRPLNMSNPKVDIAIILLPGLNHTESREYSVSPVLINPGGPAGSGVQIVQFLGRRIQEVIGREHDLIGFDPRGVGLTTPLADCYTFPSVGRVKPSKYDVTKGIFHRFTYDVGGMEVGFVNSSTNSLQTLDSRARAVAKLCKLKDDIQGQDSILRHTATPSVARDMLSIVDAWDAWRDGLEKEREIPTQVKIQGNAQEAEDSVLNTKGKLLYWGFSYGTLLGATFASMFPDRVGRLILDGVIDADFYVSPVWSESILDTDAVQESFFKYCHKAKDSCAFYRTGDSPEALKDRFGAVSRRLQARPIIGVNPRTKTPAVITSYWIRLSLFSSFYTPIQIFPIIAIVYDALDRGDDEQIHNLFALPTVLDPDIFCGSNTIIGYNYPDAQLAIMCGDKRYALNETVPNLQARYEAMAKISDFADVWTTFMLGCDGWAIKSTDPPMRWDDHPAHKQKPIKTSFPLLFISNTADPVTPLKGGVKMAHKFVGAGLIEQKSEGHCSISSASRCTIRKIREYLKEGKVPSPPEWGPEGREIEEGKWERCEPDEWPWAPFDSEQWLDSQVATGEAPDIELEQILEEARQLQVWREIRERARDVVTFFGMPRPVPLHNREGLVT